MKIIVNNEAESKLMKKFLLSVYELCIVDLMEQEDGSKLEDQYLNADDYRILSEAVFNDQTTVIVDKNEQELFYDSDDFVTGTCVDCGTETSGMSDPTILSYEDYLSMMTPEAMKTWRCDTCQIKHRSDGQV